MAAPAEGHGTPGGEATDGLLAGAGADLAEALPERDAPAAGAVGAARPPWQAPHPPLSVFPRLPASRPGGTSRHGEGMRRRRHLPQGPVRPGTAGAAAPAPFSWPPPIPEAAGPGAAEAQDAPGPAAGAGPAMAAGEDQAARRDEAIFLAVILSIAAAEVVLLCALLW